jgi:uncharacterized protein (UPF0332 family)
MILKQKSEFNLAASKQLIDSSLYAPSIHCAYYACFQLMKVALNRFCGKTYGDIDAWVASNKKSEHSYVQQEILHSIHDYDVNSYSNFNRKLKDLYNFRVNADYKDIEIKIDEASSAFDTSIELTNYMKENFHV